MRKAVSRCHCPKQHAKNKSRFLSTFLPGLFIALIPKCPFCILTYTSAITICSAKSLNGYAPHWTSWISISLTALTLIITLYNFKGYRTWIASGIILIGTVLISYSELITGLIQPYYWGCGILIFGVWVNGSLPFFIRLIMPTRKSLDLSFTKP